MCLVESLQKLLMYLNECQKCQAHGGTQGKVRESPGPVDFFLWGPGMSA